MIRYKCSILTNMDHIMFAIRSAPSTISILLAMDRSETVRCFGTRVKALWNIIFYKERYLRHDMVQVLYFDEYGSHYVGDTLGPFHHVYIIGNLNVYGSHLVRYTIGGLLPCKVRDICHYW